MSIVFEDHAPNVAAAIIILSFISCVVFPLRVYTRIKFGSWGFDDWAMTVAVIPYAALSVFCLGGAFLGIGVHKWHLDEAQSETAMMWFFFFEIFFCIAIIPIKLSIAFMLMRIAGPKRIYTTILWVVTILFVLMNTISFFYIIFRCQPVSWAWDMSTPGGKCLPTKDLADIYYADTAVNIITDWCCALLPIPLLWNLHLNTNAKISVGFLLSLGVLASLSACIRLRYTVNLNNTDDYLFSVGDVVIWGYAENGVGFIVGCIATLRPLFRGLFHLGGSNPTSPNHHPHRNTNSHRSQPRRHGKFSPYNDSALESHGSSSDGHDPYYIGSATREKTKTNVTAMDVGEDHGGDGGGGRKEQGWKESENDEEYILQEVRGRRDRGEEDGGGERRRWEGMGGIQVCRSVVQMRD
ncbi:hypothetical protein TI39_contig835g00008 [Zymoseptoria brevis]|uniref:Rhodopsin domain-containing protein n=1 Tax=Zymoseptoria brevis TaxID=1047168 RepID=A0A0F4GFI5_9PEZI|nr:hypothetical protein TI39_contig835g00008 [Zymoseptoria brevis]